MHREKHCLLTTFPACFLISQSINTNLGDEKDCIYCLFVSVVSATAGLDCKWEHVLGAWEAIILMALAYTRCTQLQTSSQPHPFPPSLANVNLLVCAGTVGEPVAFDFTC